MNSIVRGVGIYLSIELLSTKKCLGGRMKVSRELALNAIKKRIADPFFAGNVLLTAHGIKRVVDLLSVNSCAS